MIGGPGAGGLRERVASLMGQARAELAELVAIPVAQVTGFEDGIRLSITRQQVRDLPPTGELGVGWWVRYPARTWTFVSASRA